MKNITLVEIPQRKVYGQTIHRYKVTKPSENGIHLGQKYGSHVSALQEKIEQKMSITRKSTKLKKHRQVTGNSKFHVIRRLQFDTFNRWNGT